LTISFLKQFGVKKIRGVCSENRENHPPLGGAADRVMAVIIIKVKRTKVANSTPRQTFFNIFFNLLIFLDNFAKVG